MMNHFESPKVKASPANTLDSVKSKNNEVTDFTKVPDVINVDSIFDE